jgi:hypothetical protein
MKKESEKFHQAIFQTLKMQKLHGKIFGQQLFANKTGNLSKNLLTQNLQF